MQINFHNSLRIQRTLEIFDLCCKFADVFSKQQLPQFSSLQRSSSAAVRVTARLLRSVSTAAYRCTQSALLTPRGIDALFSVSHFPPHRQHTPITLIAIFETLKNISDCAAQLQHCKLQPISSYIFTTLLNPHPNIVGLFDSATTHQLLASATAFYRNAVTYDPNLRVSADFLLTTVEQKI